MKTSAKPQSGLLTIFFLMLMLAGCSSSREQTKIRQYKDTTLTADTARQHTLPASDALTREALLGKIKPYQDTGFVKIGRQYTDKSDTYLRKEAYHAFLRMAEAASNAGLPLQIISATRNFNDQKRIWENKWTGRQLVDGQNLSQTLADPAARAVKILEFSSMPGTSRHHWGTDIDLNSLNNAYFNAGRGLKIYEWLQSHAPAYGFCQVYTAKSDDRPYGYNEEKWHWSYMPLAGPFLKQYLAKVSYQDINGFQGAEVAEQINIIQQYVQGIAPACIERVQDKNQP